MKTNDALQPNQVLLFDDLKILVTTISKERDKEKIFTSSAAKRKLKMLNTSYIQSKHNQIITQIPMGLQVMPFLNMSNDFVSSWSFILGLNLLIKYYLGFFSSWICWK